MKKRKICFAASTGGHFEQLMKLKPLMSKYDSFLVTEKTHYDVNVQGMKVYHLHQVNRREKTHVLWLIVNSFRSVGIVVREKPAVMVTTGVLAMIPLALLTKMTGGKLIYIESFAKVHSPNLTGKLLYRFADQFYVQWESMKEFYPDAIYVGGIY